MRSGSPTMLVLALICLGAAALPGWAYLEKQEVAARAQTFREVPARVTTSTTYEETNRDGDGETERSTHARIHFEYRVDGVDYVGRSIYLDVAEPSSFGSTDIVAEHPVGSQTVAYYDPHDPSVSCLLREEAPGGGFLLIIACVFAGVGVLLFLQWLLALLLGRRRTWPGTS